MVRPRSRRPARGNALSRPGNHLFRSLGYTAAVYTAPLHNREPRQSVFLTALIEGVDGAAAPHRVMNLSRRGACVSPAGDLAPGRQVSVTIGSVKHVTAEVMWVRE